MNKLFICFNIIRYNNPMVSNECQIRMHFHLFQQFQIKIQILLIFYKLQSSQF